jgi:hypothetical protein
MVRGLRMFVFVVALLVPLLIAVVTAAAARPAAAQSATPCLDQFTVLRTHTTEDVSITGGKVDKERAGLVKLVDDAQALASIGKTADAVTKLRNFTVKVDQLEAAGRLSAESAALLRTDAAATIACLQGTP